MQYKKHDQLISVYLSYSVLKSHTSAVHRFKWDFVFVVVISVHLIKLINASCSQSLFDHYIRCHMNAWRLNMGFGTQKKCPFPLNSGVPSLGVTDTKIMWTFFCDQSLCPLNGGVPRMEVSQRRGFSVCYKNMCYSHLSLHFELPVHSHLLGFLRYKNARQLGQAVRASDL